MGIQAGIKEVVYFRDKGASGGEGEQCCYTASRRLLGMAGIEVSHMETWCTCVYTYTRIHCIHLYTHLYIWMYICVCMYVYVCMYICMYVYVRMCINIDICILNTRGILRRGTEVLFYSVCRCFSDYISCVIVM